MFFEIAFLVSMTLIAASIVISSLLSKPTVISVDTHLHQDTPCGVPYQECEECDAMEDEIDEDDEEFDYDYDDDERWDDEEYAEKMAARGTN